MSNYCDEPAMCRVDIFKPSGKWGYSFAVKFDESKWGEEDPMETFERSLGDYLEKRTGLRYLGEGMYAVCLEPFVKHSYPLMIVGTDG